MARSSVDNRAMDKLNASIMRALRLRIEVQWAIMYDVQPAIFNAQAVKESIEEEFFFVVRI